MLREGAARTESHRELPIIAPCVPAAVSTDSAAALEMASWWVSFYLMNMGPLYRETLRRLGHGGAVDDVIAANPTGRTFEVPESARVLIDELTLCGDAEQAREALDRWSADGAQRPMVVLPPDRPIEELDYMLEAFCN